MWKCLVPSALIWFEFAKMEVEELEGGAGNHFHYVAYNTYTLICISFSIILKYPLFSKHLGWSNK